MDHDERSTNGWDGTVLDNVGLPVLGQCYPEQVWHKSAIAVIASTERTTTDVVYSQN